MHIRRLIVALLFTLLLAPLTYAQVRSTMTDDQVMSFIMRESQKGIIIGHKGIALKKVSTEARKSLERFFNKSIYLEVFVKVNKDWRNNERALEGFGYKLKD